MNARPRLTLELLLEINAAFRTTSDDEERKANAAQTLADIAVAVREHAEQELAAVLLEQYSDATAELNAYLTEATLMGELDEDALNTLLNREIAAYRRFLKHLRAIVARNQQ